MRVTDDRRPLRFSIFRWLGGGGLALLVFGYAAVASAQYGHDFTPYQCVPCGTGWEEVDWRYDVGGYNSELPLDPNHPSCGWPTGCATYSNNLQERRYVVGNQFVSQYSVHLDELQTEYGWDFLSIGTQTDPNPLILTGGVQPGWIDVPPWLDLQVNPGKIDFHSDFTETRRGFLLDRVRVCCSVDPGPGAFDVTEHRRHTGVLLATNDVVYFRFPREQNVENAVAIWPMPGVTADFDLYAKCNQLPTFQSPGLPPSASTGSKEFLRLQENDCAIGGTFYIAVHSYSGQGGFNLVRVKRNTNAPHVTLRAGTGFNATPEEMQLFRQMLQDAAGAIFGATEGLVWIDRVDLFNSGACLWCEGAFGFCDLCFIRGGRSNYNGIRTFITNDMWSFTPGGQVGNYGPKGIAHEWGHQYIGAHDEYVDVNDASLYQCGHSIMASWFRRDQNNMCSHDHELDPDATAPPSGTHTSVWDRMAWQWSPNGVSPTDTPDNYNFLGSGVSPMTGAVVEDFFNFNGEVGVVVQH